MDHKETTLFDLLRAFFHACGRGMKACGNTISQSIRLSWRKAYIVLPLVALFLAAGFYWTRPTNRRYRVDAVLLLNGPTEFEVAQALIPVEFAMGKGMSETQNLEDLLGLPYEVARKTCNFEHFPVVDFLCDSVPDAIDYSRKMPRTDTLNVIMPNRIAVRFQTKDIQSVPAVQQGLLNYLNSLAPIQAAYEAKKTDVTRIVDFCNSQVEVLDSFITEFYFHQGVSQQAEFAGRSLLIGQREVTTLHGDMFDLFRKRQLYTHELSQMTAPVCIDTRFALCPAPVRNPILWSVLFAFVGWILGLILAAFIEQRKAILRWLRS